MTHPFTIVTGEGMTMIPPTADLLSLDDLGRDERYSPALPESAKGWTEQELLDWLGHSLDFALALGARAEAANMVYADRCIAAMGLLSSFMKVDPDEDHIFEHGRWAFRITEGMISVSTIERHRARVKAAARHLLSRLDAAEAREREPGLGLDSPVGSDESHALPPDGQL